MSDDKNKYSFRRRDTGRVVEGLPANRSERGRIPPIDELQSERQQSRAAQNDVDRISEVERRLASVERSIRPSVPLEPFIIARKGATNLQFVELTVPDTGTTLTPIVSGGRNCTADTDPIAPLDLGQDDWLLLTKLIAGQVKSIRVAGGAIRDIRYNATAGWIQVSYKSSPQESDWVNKIQVSTCPSGAARGTGEGARVSGSPGTSEQDSEGSPIDMTPATVNSKTVRVDTGETSPDGASATTLITAGASGATLVRVDALAVEDVTDGVIWIYHQPGGSGTKFLIGEIAVQRTNVETSSKRWTGSWIAPDTKNGFLLEAGDKIYVSTYNSEKFNVTANGADY